MMEPTMPAMPPPCSRRGAWPAAGGAAAFGPAGPREAELIEQVTYEVAGRLPDRAGEVALGALGALVGRAVAGPTVQAGGELVGQVGEGLLGLLTGPVARDVGDDAGGRVDEVGE